MNYAKLFLIIGAILFAIALIITPLRFLIWRLFGTGRKRHHKLFLRWKKIANGENDYMNVWAYQLSPSLKLTFSHYDPKDVDAESLTLWLSFSWITRRITFEWAILVDRKWELSGYWDKHVDEFVQASESIRKAHEKQVRKLSAKASSEVLRELGGRL